MAININTITVVGNLTRDPELRYTQSGKATVAVGIAVNRSFQQNGEWKEATTFMNVVAWDQLAENIAASLTKGTRVVVTGRLDVREYEAREGGKRTSVDIVAEDIGPTLRWATVTVERTPAKGSGEGGGSAPRQAPRSSGTPASAPADDGYYADEEPF